MRHAVHRHAELQLAATLLVVGAALGAELAALALAAAPGSALLWWLNLEVFAMLNAGFRMVDGTVPLSPGLTLPALAGAAALAVAAYGLRLRLGLAMLSHAAFLATGFLAFSWYFERFGGPGRTASLENVIADFDAGAMLAAFLLAASLAGFAVSHLAYLDAARRERG